MEFDDNLSNGSNLTKRSVSTKQQYPAVNGKVNGTVKTTENVQDPEQNEKTHPMVRSMENSYNFAF